MEGTLYIADGNSRSCLVISVKGRIVTRSKGERERERGVLHPVLCTKIEKR